MIGENAYANFSDPLLDLDIAMHDNDISLEVPVPNSDDQVADPDNEATNADTDEKVWGSNGAGGLTLWDKSTANPDDQATISEQFATNGITASLS